MVGILPDRESIIRLVGAVLVEQYDEWEAADRRHLSKSSMAELKTIDAAPVDSIEEVISLPELTSA